MFFFHYLLVNYIRTHSLGSYPVQKHESAREVLDSVYLYGKLDLGGGLTRMVFARPTLPPAIDFAASLDLQQLEGMDQGQGQNQFMGCRVCVLPGLVDLGLFKEALTSATFLVEIHREDISKRAFHARNVDEYNRMFSEVEEGGSRPPSAPAAAAKPAAAPAKGAAAPLTGVSANPALSQPSGPASKQDIFLLQCISR